MHMLHAHTGMALPPTCILHAHAYIHTYLFRQDLLLASLFRNFLIAQRVMNAAGLYPVSAPALPPMHHHPLWDSFDLVAEAAICAELARRDRGAPSPPPSTFFSDQLTAFEVWLRRGARGSRRPPEQLPILLQVSKSVSQ